MNGASRVVRQMAQSTTKTQQAAKKANKQPRKEIGWTPLLIGGAIVLVIAIVVSVAIHSKTNPHKSTVPPTIAAGTKVWTGEVALKVNQQYALDHPSAVIDVACTRCILVEGVYPYGMAISDSGGIQTWLQGAPTYQDCATALAGKSLAAIALYDPPTYASPRDLKPGGYMCAYANSGNVLSLRYDGPINHGNAFKFKATSFSVG
jgi:hypothetical protein